MRRRGCGRATAPSPQSHRLREGEEPRIFTMSTVHDDTSRFHNVESSHRGDRPPSPLPPRLRVPRSSPPSAVVGRAAGTWWRRHGLACMRFSVSRVCRTSTRGNARRASAPRRRIRRDWPRRTSVIAVQPRSRLAFTARRRAGSSGLNSYPYAVGVPLPVGVVSTVVRLSGPSPAPRGTRLASSRGPRLERRRRGFRITGKAHRQTKTTHRRPRLKSPFTKHYGKSGT